MILFYKFVAIFGTGAAVGLLFFLLLRYLTTRLSMRTLSKDRFSGLTVTTILNLLLKNKNTKQTTKARLIVALLVFFLALLLFSNVVFSLMAGLAVYISLKSYADKKAQSKLDLFNDQLIDTLGVITNAVRSGQSLQQALEIAAQESKPPLADEFAQVLQEIKLGTPIAQALLNMTKRIPSNDLRMSVNSINLAKEAGGNMAEILAFLAETMRERKKIQGKVRALTAQGKASGMVMGGIPFFLLIVLYFLEPEMFGLLFTTLAGNIMLFAVVAMVATGMFFINKIIKVDI